MSALQEQHVKRHENPTDVIHREFQIYQYFVSISSIFFLCTIKKAKTHKLEKVLMNLHLCHTKTATCTRDIISNVPAINTINRHDVFACTLLYRELYNNH